MIFDKLSNSTLYAPLHRHFEPAFSFLQRDDLAALEPGKYAIDDDRLFAVVDKEQGRKKGEALLEAHNKYIDIQLVVSGVDEMGWRSRDECIEPATEYSEEQDIQFFNDSPTTWVRTPPKHFAIFFPGDAHLPLMGDGLLHKVIVKIAV